MKKKPFITALQLVFMTSGSALVFPYTFMPILNTPPSNQDVWIVLIMTIAYMFLLNIPLLVITNNFRGLSFNETFEMILGKFFGKLMALFYVLFFAYCFTACMLIVSMFINLYLFPDTPTWGLLVTILIAVCYAAYNGAGTIGRLSTIFVPIIIFTIVTFFLMGLGKMDWGVLRPVLADSKFIDMNIGAFLTAARYSETIIFFLFAQYIDEKVNINKTYIRAVLTFAVNFMLILLPTILVLGIDFARIAWNPYYVYTRQVKALGFLERMQAINTLAWFPLALLKLSLYNYMASNVFSEIVGAKSHKSFVIPIAVLGFIVCLVPILDTSSTIELLRSDRIFPFVTLPVIFVFPLIIMIVFLIRKKKIKVMLKRRQQSAAGQ
mgnify:CR=1 FL=1